MLTFQTWPLGAMAETMVQASRAGAGRKRSGKAVRRRRFVGGVETFGVYGGECLADVSVVV